MRVRLHIFAPASVRLAAPLRRLLQLLKIRRGAWSITLVGDVEMAALHGRTMGLPSTTDVLTFDMRERSGDAEEGAEARGKKQGARSNTQEAGGKKGQRGIDGDLDLDTVICIDEARRRAAEFGHSVERELLLYALHSLLHVQGYDDRTRRDFARMHAREDELLRAIGVGAVYEPAGRGEGSRAARPARAKKRPARQTIGKARAASSGRVP